MSTPTLDKTSAPTDDASVVSGSAVSDSVVSDAAAGSNAACCGDYLGSDCPFCDGPETD